VQVDGRQLAVFPPLHAGATDAGAGLVAKASGTAMPTPFAKYK
jgi:hypothetical protein